MARYIDANKLNGYEFGLISPKAQDLFHKIINNAPTEDVKPIIYATLLVDEDGNMKCSNCGNSECWGNYCMNCGADMKRE